MRAQRNRLADDGDGVRASDAERDAAIGQLSDRFAEGMLSQDSFLFRMGAALRAKARSDLSELLADLPHPERQRGLGRWLGNGLVRLGDSLARAGGALTGHSRTGRGRAGAVSAVPAL